MLPPTLSSCVVVVCIARASHLYNAPFLLPHFDVMCVSALQCHTLVSCIYNSISAVTVVTKAYVALTKHKPAGQQYLEDAASGSQPSPFRFVCTSAHKHRLTPVFNGVA